MQRQFRHSRFPGVVAGPWCDVPRPPAMAETLAPPRFGRVNSGRTAYFLYTPAYDLLYGDSRSQK